MHSPIFYYLFRLSGTIIDLIKLRWILLAVSGLLFAPPLFAGDVEYKVKAGYLYNFTKFITWPKDGSSTFNLCILGADPFGALLDPIEQRTAFAKPIKLFRLEDIGALARTSKSNVCHILFISSALGSVPVQQSKNVLTVGESEGFARNGGMIGFITENSRIKLQINWRAFKNSDLKVSAKLLEVADIIGDEHD